MLQNQQFQMELVQYQNSNFVRPTPNHEIENLKLTKFFNTIKLLMSNLKALPRKNKIQKFQRVMLRNSMIL